MAAVEGGLEASQRGVVGRDRPLAQNELSEMLTRQADMCGLFISAALITITQLRSSTRRNPRVAVDGQRERRLPVP